MFVHVIFFPRHAFQVMMCTFFRPFNVNTRSKMKINRNFPAKSFFSKLSFILKTTFLLFKDKLANYFLITLSE